MCARYALSLPLSVVAELFGALIDPEHADALQAFEAPRFRVLPGQRIPIVRLVNGRRLLQSARWGWSPAASRAGGARTPQINVRIEGLQRRAFAGGADTDVRCLVPATGWYEFTGVEGARTAWFFSDDADSPAPVAFAGLLQQAASHFEPTAIVSPGRRGEAAELTLAVLTRAAAPEIRHLHDRMPAAVQVPGTSWLEDAITPVRETTNESGAEARWYARPVNLQGGHTQDDDERMLQPPAQTRLF